MTADTERTELLGALAERRNFLRYTVRELDDEQARKRTTVSELTLGGLIKHVAETEERWLQFVVEGPSVMEMPTDDAAWEAWSNGHRMLADETLSGLLDRYQEVERRTEEIVRSLPDLDVAHPLPEAPWFEPGATWTARRVLLHMIGETAQHAGHADILREAIDGSKTMG